jgi:dinuclear metal center YbgI/SA1388 family protein
VEVLVGDLLSLLETEAPAVLAQPGDNSGLLVGDERAVVRRVLLALEVTGEVCEEALSLGCDSVLTHHPFVFAPVRTLVESRERERLLCRLVREHLTLVACHTNLDAAPKGLAHRAGEALGLLEMRPLEPAPSGWAKLVGFVPEPSVEDVAAAVFAAGSGGMGNYKECAFAAAGTGWFTPLPGSNPTVGSLAQPERAQELRWETVVPRSRLSAAIRAFVDTHPYEEPAFDIYPVENILPNAGLGRIGLLPTVATVEELAAKVQATFEVSSAAWCGDGARQVARVGVLPGSGRGMLGAAAGRCDVLITGDLGYHSADEAAESGLALVDVPHGEFEWWAFKAWGTSIAERLEELGVSLFVSQKWSAPWVRTGRRREGAVAQREGVLRVWIDGGSRGNPGPSAIGVVVEDGAGLVLESIGRVIEEGTNNVAEYRALLTGLDVAHARDASAVEVISDSELLVKQMLGEYKVKNEGLKSLFAEAQEKAQRFRSFAIRHVDRGQNTRADALVNRALDEQERAGL